MSVSVCLPVCLFVCVCVCVCVSALAVHLADQTKVYKASTAPIPLTTITTTLVQQVHEPKPGVTAEDLVLRALALYPSFFVQLLEK
eukprot:COSAG05_NODE_5072_length_1271_cov_10.886131_2_plen_86_part_00